MSGISGSIWVGPFDYGAFQAGPSVLTRDWPRDESDPRSLFEMIDTYQTTPGRMADVEQLRGRLVEILQQAIASDGPNSPRAVQWLADVYLCFGQYGEAEQLYLKARDQQLAKSGAGGKGFLDLTEELVRFYLDVLNRCAQAEPLCRELWETRRGQFGAGSPPAIRTAILLGRIRERQRRYQEAERIYLDLLNLKPAEKPQGSTPEVDESIFGAPFSAPLSRLLDEQSLALKLLEDPNTGFAREKLWPASAHHLLARLYTACPMAAVRDVTKAIEHGTLACELSGWAEPICLDTLAAAYAEAGQFDLAIRRQNEALEHLFGDNALMRKRFENRLARYEHGVAKQPEALVAHWKFEPGKDGMMADTSGNNLDGRLNGKAQVYADPERGNVLRLEGEEDWVDCGADSRYDLTEAITVSAWIKVGKSGSPWQAIVAKGPAWRLQRCPLQPQPDRPADVLEFACFGVNATGSGGALWDGIRGRTSVNDGKWHHVAGVYDGRRLSLYVDGELDAFAPAIAFTCIFTSKVPVLIGRNGAVQEQQDGNGLIDDVRIYSYGLSAQDIKALHEGKEPSADKAPIR